MLVQALGHIPTEGEEAVVDGVRLQAECVEGHRIVQVRVTPEAEPVSDDDPAAPGDEP